MGLNMLAREAHPLGVNIFHELQFDDDVIIFTITNMTCDIVDIWTVACDQLVPNVIQQSCPTFIIQDPSPLDAAPKLFSQMLADTHPNSKDYTPIFCRKMLLPNVFIFLLDARITNFINSKSLFSCRN